MVFGENPDSLGVGEHNQAGGDALYGRYPVELSSHPGMGRIGEVHDANCLRRWAGRGWGIGRQRRRSRHGNQGAGGDLRGNDPGTARPGDINQRGRSTTGALRINVGFIEMPGRDKGIYDAAADGDAGIYSDLVLLRRRAGESSNAEGGSNQTGFDSHDLILGGFLAGAY